MNPRRRLHRARRRRRHVLRRWPRRILLLVNILVALCLLSAGSVYAYVRVKIGSIRVVAAPHLTPTAKVPGDSSGGLSPENILLIGNETRAGLGTDEYGNPAELSGSLSDVIMILHLDPARESASILSIPRDLFVPQPTGGEVGPYQKIDAALNDGANGPDNLIQAITDDFGIPINHYVELNFDGFQQTVNALGGIDLDFPERVFDLESNLDIRQTGCQHLNGTQALALVRSRHLQYDPPGVDPDDPSVWPYDPESDLSRIVRDHTFLRVLASTAMSEGLTNPIKANGFIDGLINQITVDPGLRDQLVSLATHYRHLDPATAPETTLPVNTVGGTSGYTYDGVAIGDIEFANQPLDDRTIQAWDAQALPAVVAPSAVEVDDESGAGIGSQVAAGLRADGLAVTDVTSGEQPADPAPTWVDYAPGDEGNGLAVVDDLSGAVMLRPDADLSAGTVQVELGTASSVTGAGATAASGSTTTSSPTTAPGSATTTAPQADQENNLGGDADIDPTPSAAADQITPWDPRPC